MHGILPQKILSEGPWHEATSGTLPPRMTEAFDPFSDVRGFRYTGDVHAAYPLSPKTRIPASIRKPNYGREAVRTR